MLPEKSPECEGKRRFKASIGIKGSLGSSVLVSDSFADLFKTIAISVNDEYSYAC